MSTQQRRQQRNQPSYANRLQEICQRALIIETQYNKPVKVYIQYGGYNFQLLPGSRRITSTSSAAGELNEEEEKKIAELMALLNWKPQFGETGQIPLPAELIQ